MRRAYRVRDFNAMRNTIYAIRKKTQNAKRNTQYGFTLIEIMISVAILSVGLVLILQGLTHSLNILRISQDNLKATLLAENKMAELEIKAREGKEVFLEDLGEEFEFEDMECEWGIEITPVEWEIEEIPEEYEELNGVEASLSWKEGKRKGRIPLVTYMRSQPE